MVAADETRKEMQRKVKVTLTYMIKLLYFEANGLSFALPLLLYPPFEITFLPGSLSHIDFSPKASPATVRCLHSSCSVEGVWCRMGQIVGHSPWSSDQPDAHRRADGTP